MNVFFEGVAKVTHFCYTIGMTNYGKIFEYAIDNHGLVTTSAAHAMGISSKTLVDLAHRGRLTRIGQGVYQLVQYAPSANDPYAQAVALVGESAYLYGESVLAMLGLAATNPDLIYVATPNRVRRKLGQGIVVCRAAVGERTVILDGILAQPVADAIRSARSTVPAERLRQATEEAYRIGKISQPDKENLLNEL